MFNIKKVNVSSNDIAKGIKTRYDDIAEEIRTAKFSSGYFNQTKPSTGQGSYTLGSVFGNVLNKVI